MTVWEMVTLFLCRCMHFFLKYCCAFDRKLVDRIEKLKTKRADARLPRIMNWEESVFPEDEVWCARNLLIAHACGGNVRMAYTNAQEALHRALHDGFRVIEVDVRFTKDNKLVCAHDPVDADYLAFVNTPIDGRFTPMGIEACLGALNERMTLIVDVKNHDIDAAVKYISGVGHRCNVVVQIFDESHFNMANPYDVVYNLTFTKNYERVTAFCLDKGIPAVTISKDQFMRDDSWKVLIKHNIKIFVHTVNKLDDYRTLRRIGAAGVITDTLLPSEL